MKRREKRGHSPKCAEAGKPGAGDSGSQLHPSVARATQAPGAAWRPLAFALLRQLISKAGALRSGELMRRKDKVAEALS